MKGKNALAVVTVILVVLVLAWLILSMDTPSGDHAEAEHQEAHTKHEEGKKGDQGLHGRRLAQDGFEIEIGLSEAEGAPHFRAAAYVGEKPVSPEAVQLTLDLQRPGKEPEIFYFQVEGGHLRSREAIAEPHVFAVKAVAEYQGKTYRWNYWQVEDGIELPSGAVEEAGIEVKAAGSAVLKTVLALPGEIQLNPRQVAHVVPRVEGVVVEVRKELGDTVKQGDVLAVLESRELAELKSDYLVALGRLNLTRATFAREERLWKEKISAEQDYLVAMKERAEAKILVEAAAQKLHALGITNAELPAIASGTATAFNRYALQAPFEGEVVEKHLARGESAEADARVFTIADLSTVWAEITVYAKDLASVRAGQAVEVRAADTAHTAGGKLFYVGRLVGEQTRAAKAYVEIPNPERR